MICDALPERGQNAIGKKIVAGKKRLGENVIS